MDRQIGVQIEGERYIRLVNIDKERHGKLKFTTIKDGQRRAVIKVFLFENDSMKPLKEIEVDSRAGSPIVGIGENVVIENAIIDKNARIGDNVRLVNEENVTEGTFNGFEVREGIIVVNKNAIIRSGTTF